MGCVGARVERGIGAGGDMRKRWGGLDVHDMNDN